MSSLTLTEDNTECVDEKISHYNCVHSSEHVQSSDCVNYYDNYVMEQLKTEFPEGVLPQTDCIVNHKMGSENKELLKIDVKAEVMDENTENGLSFKIKEEKDYNEYPFTVKMEGLEEQEDVNCKYNELLEIVIKEEINDENTEDGLSLNVKEENGYNEYPVTVKTERLEEQEDVQYNFYDNTLNNGCNLLQNSNNHIKVEIDIPVGNGITELHQCQYCGKGFDNYNNMLVHISNDHKQEKSKCDICGKQFKSVGNLSRHLMTVHKLDKPLQAVTENFVNYVDFQQKFSLNDHSKLSCSGMEDGEDESENKVTKNIMNYDYRTMLECQDGKQFPSLTHLHEHENLIYRPNIPKTNNEILKCDPCKKFFKTKWSLDRHIKAVHFDYGRKFECWCGKLFRSPIHLSGHQRHIHGNNAQNTNDSNFQCDYCKIFAKTKSNLLLHIQRVHYDYGKQFDCWCGKQFRSPIHLRDHQRLSHLPKIPKTNDEKFQCDSCKTYLASKTSLARHIMGVHFYYGTMFDCWCGKQFRSPIHLRDHQRLVHRSEMPQTSDESFRCDSCEKSFYTKSNLARHVKAVHFDYGRKFECWCGKQFRAPIYLRRHDRLIHKRYVHNTING